MNYLNNLLRGFIAILINFSTTSCQETEFQRKEKMYTSINQKYKDKGFIGISEVYSRAQQIKIYSTVYLEKQNTFGNQEINKLSDSLQSLFFLKYNILKDEYQQDIDSVNSYSSTFLPELYEKTHNETAFKKNLYTAYKANKDVSFEDLLYYFDNYRFLLSKDSGYEYATSVSDDDAEKWMSNWDGSISSFQDVVKKQLHDPSSFEHVETSYNTKHGEAKVRMKFRAKNKLGAKVLNQADGILNTSDGSVSSVTIQ